MALCTEFVIVVLVLYTIFKHECNDLERLVANFSSLEMR